MLVKVSPASLKQTHWYEYVIRFVLGGAATVLAGVIGSWFGPDVGGLFMALPVIFCASATLVQNHQIKTKKRAGMRGERRGREAAALDAAGAALGSVGLIVFALVFYASIQRSVSGAFASAIISWTGVSVAMWWLRRKLRIVHAPRAHGSSTTSLLSRR
jgi:uncharacterized membrane protein YfcA